MTENIGWLTEALAPFTCLLWIVAHRVKEDPAEPATFLREGSKPDGVRR
jgi:hypothetical protein